MLRFSLERPKCTGLEMSTCEGQLRLSVLETELERQGWDGLEMCRTSKMG